MNLLTILLTTGSPGSALYREVSVERTPQRTGLPKTPEVCRTLQGWGWEDTGREARPQKQQGEWPVMTEGREDSRERSQVGTVVASTGTHLWVAPYKATRVCAAK